MLQIKCEMTGGFFSERRSQLVADGVIEVNVNKYTKPDDWQHYGSWFVRHFKEISKDREMGYRDHEPRSYRIINLISARAILFALTDTLTGYKCLKIIIVAAQNA
jgi:hypothetical protein